MSEWATDNDSVFSAYDAWAVIDLDALTVVHANAVAHRFFGSEDDTPFGIERLAPTEDPAVLIDTIVPIVRSGEMWSGMLRLGARGELRGQVRADRYPTVVVPQLSPGTDDISRASMLFAIRSAPDAVDILPDPLTGLPTRSALYPRLERAVAANRSTNSLLVTLFLDLDGLKNINDRYGHEVGDRALIQAAERIVSRIPDEALAVRFGGDEFVVIHEGIGDLDEAQALAEDILDALTEVGGYDVISASIGMAVCRSGEVTADELLRRADTAMYRAKARGGSQVAIFDADMRNRQQAAEALRAAILSTIADNGFGVAAQPIFELATGRILAVELFIRVRHDAPYIENANQLFRLAHEFGEAFDAAVLDRALVLARRWHTSLGERAPRVQVNVSAQSLASPHFASRLREAIRHDNVRPASIAFEIDSRDLTTGAERERSTIDELQSLGARIVVDGFGDDELSLPALADWNPAMVKLDGHKHTQPVLTGLLRAVSTLRIPTCVKGLSEPDALEHAVRIGAFAGQGNALTPVRGVERVNAQLHAPQRIGF